MKILYITVLLIFNTLYANELLWVDNKIAAIKPARVGLKNSDISKLQNPFMTKELAKKIVLKAKKAVKKRAQQKKRAVLYKKHNLSLQAVMNKSALINGKWYRVGHLVDKYKLIHILRDRVILARNGFKIVLTTKSKNSKLNFKND